VAAVRVTELDVRYQNWDSSVVLHLEPGGAEIAGIRIRLDDASTRWACDRGVTAGDIYCDVRLGVRTAGGRVAACRGPAGQGNTAFVGALTRVLRVAGRIVDEVIVVREGLRELRAHLTGVDAPVDDDV
jgi:hypothetical protein